MFLTLNFCKQHIDLFSPALFSFLSHASFFSVSFISHCFSSLPYSSSTIFYLLFVVVVVVLKKKTQGTVSQ